MWCGLENYVTTIIREINLTNSPIFNEDWAFSNHNIHLWKLLKIKIHPRNQMTIPQVGQRWIYCKGNKTDQYIVELTTVDANKAIGFVLITNGLFNVGTVYRWSIWYDKSWEYLKGQDKYDNS